MTARALGILPAAPADAAARQRAARRDEARAA